MRIPLLFLLLLIFSVPAHAQNADTLSLETCYQLAKKNYPLLQQDPLWEQKLHIAIRNLNSYYLPQLSLNAQAAYQSEVTEVPIRIPGQSIPEVPNDQYKATLDIQQLIFDGGAIKKQKSLQQTTTSLAQQQQNITLHQLKKQLNKWFASALALQANERMQHLQQTNLINQITKTEAAIKNGALLSSQADELKVALLKVRQQLKELHAGHHAVLQALSLVTGRPLSDTLQLILPVVKDFYRDDSIQRPELKQFAMQDKLLQQQSSLLQTQNIPKISAFIQGGYGRPGLNMLSDHFDWFYMAGIRLHWNLWDWHERQRKQQSLQIDVQQLHLQKEDFLLQTGIALEQEQSTIHSLEESIKNDYQIAVLRERIRKTASSQLENGIITPTEYLIKLNDETAARIRQQIHIIQLHFAKLNYQLLKGK